MKKILVIGIMIILLLTAEVIIVKSASNYEPQVEVIYARVKITEGTMIAKDMLYKKKISISMIHSQSVKSEDAVIGKTALTDIEADEMILSSKAGQKNEMEDIQLTDKDNRLYSIELRPDQVNGWWVKVGQYVDIICVPNDLKTIDPVMLDRKNTQLPTVTEGQDNAAEESIVKLENIRIAAIIDENGKLLTNEQRTSNPKIISFEVQPGQDEYLAWAKSNARIEISTITDKDDK